MTLPAPRKLGSSGVTLYSLALKPMSEVFNQVCQEHEVIPGNVLVDIYLQVVEDNSRSAKALKDHLSQLDVFMKLLLVKPLRDKLHLLFKNLTNRDIRESVFSELYIKPNGKAAPTYRHLVLDLLGARLAGEFENLALKEINQEHCRERLLKIGTELGEFFIDAGWNEEAAKVYNQCMYICLAESSEAGCKRSIKCMERLLVAQTSYSQYSQARMTFETANVIIKKLKDAEVPVNFAGIYSAFSGLFYLECHYSEALEWSVKALEELKSVMQSAEPKMVIDILRQSAKACVVKREFHKAELLVKEAVYLARDIYGSKSVKYADALADYGYYLLNRDGVDQAVEVYRDCIQIRKAAFGRYNFMTAVILEDLAYALYVKEYSSGIFDEPRRFSQKAISIMDVILPSNHLQLASVKRVKALILEEIAIDSQGSPIERGLLKEAEALHLHALALSKQIFGEINVQIAKHYGNLGRLYQSMRKYPEAEAMHLKAISIKEELLGAFDYEVALSIGHLASLYNYDMSQYRKAEELHLRSISIGKRLFGDGYSGLEYDYRGLMQIYSMENDQQKFDEYSRIFTQWKMLRDLKAANRSDRPISDKQFSRPVSQVLHDFFEMKWVNMES